MAWGKKPTLFGITPEIREFVEQADLHAAFAANNVSRQVELQVAINRHRNAWDKWVEAKALLKSSRDVWQVAFDVYRQAGGRGPTVAEQLAGLHEQESARMREQQEAFTAGNLEAAKSAFDTLQEVLSKIRQIEETATNKEVTPEEVAKQAAQKQWKRAQDLEADSRNAHLTALALLLTLAEQLDEKGAKEYGRLLKNPPEIRGLGIAAFTDADANISRRLFSLPDVGDDGDAVEAETEERTSLPDEAEVSNAPSQGLVGE